MKNKIYKDMAVLSGSLISLADSFRNNRELWELRSIAYSIHYNLELKIRATYK